MDWASIIIAVIGALAGGGLISLLTIRETRKGLKIDNAAKEDERWSKLADELQDQNEKLNERLDKKDALLQEKDDIIATLRHELDDTRTALVKATLLRCSKLACPDRVPPLGYSELTTDELIAEKKRLNLE